MLESMSHRAEIQTRDPAHLEAVQVNYQLSEPNNQDFAFSDSQSLN